MKRFPLVFLASILLSILTTASAFAFSGDMSINSQDISFSPNTFLEGKTIRIYATAKNNSQKDLLGIVRFYDNDTQIGADQAISIFSGKSDGVFIDWTPAYGNHKVAVKIFPWQPELDDPSNNWIVENVFAGQDTDHDGITNSEDEDDDGDGVKDTEDDFPLTQSEQKDTDGDGKGDNADKDDDNDGVPDEFDDLPLDPNETIDTDKDGIGNIADTDDDGDSISDTDEEKGGTLPLLADSDQDGVNDDKDAFPLNPHEQLDTDKDGIGNNTDIDDDNDGIPDENDPYPLNKPPIIALKDELSTIDLLKDYTFDATPSYDEDGEIVNYQWEIDGMPVREGNSLDYFFNENGPHKLKLTVTDNSGEQISKEFQLSVLNLGLYEQLIISFLAISLALFLYLKYIAAAREPEGLSKSDRSAESGDKMVA